MATPTEIAAAYVAAQNAHDLDAALALWRPGAVDRLVGEHELVAPDEIRSYLAGVYAAFPDFALEVVELTAEGERVAVRWRATATFAGPGAIEGFAPNHGRAEIEGCDVLTVSDGLIVHNDAYSNFADTLRQLGLLPAAGSSAQRRLAHLTNLRTRAQQALHAGTPEPVADGVWVLRGGFPLRTMNVYLIEGPGGVTVFDASIRGMGPAIMAAAAAHGGIERVVLGHADVDHRGAAPELDAPVFCHSAERAAAESGDAARDYHDRSKLRPYARPFYATMFGAWNGGPVAIAGTVAEGDEVAGFRVIELPGHAPGQIGLLRESDRLALCSDTVYTLDIETGVSGGPRIAHPAFDQDVEQARASVRKLADLEPAVVWAGHADPVTGDVVGQLRSAAAAAPGKTR